MSKIQSIKLNNAKGFSIVELLIVVTIVAILVAISIPNLLSSRRAANEAAAISTVRLIIKDEVAYRFASLDGTFGTLPELASKNFLDERFNGSNVTAGYSYRVLTLYPTATAPSRYTIQADPVTHSLANSLTGTGTRNFGATEVGTIHQTSDNTTVSFDDLTRLPLGSATFLRD